MGSYLYVLKKYSSFSHKEIARFLLTAIFVGFFFSFNDWGFIDEAGVATIDYGVGLANLLIAIFSVLLILGLVILAQKSVALIFGYVIKYMMSWVSLLAGFFIMLFSNGMLVFFLPGACRYEIKKTARLGKYRSFFNNNELFLIASLAVAVPLIISIPFSALYIFTEMVIFKTLVFVSLLIAAFSLIPIPNLAAITEWKMRGVTDFKLLRKLDGGTYGYDMFSFNLTAYVLLAFYTFVFIFLTLLFNIFSLILILIFGFVLFFVYKIMILYMID